MNTFGRWPEVSVNEVHWAMLHSEFDLKLSPAYRQRLLAAHPGIVSRPNFSDRNENLNRYVALLSIRGNLLQWVPASTKWARTRLSSAHVDRLRVFGRVEHGSPHDQNEVSKAKWPRAWIGR